MSSAAGGFRRRLRYLLGVGLRRRVRDLALAGREDDRFLAREDLARRYLRGSGIELGALTFPLRVPPGASVRYVDHLSRSQLIALNGEMLSAAGVDPAGIPETDVIDDGARLAAFADRSVDFVIANHVLEHIEDPIASLEHWLRVLAPGGILFITLPDARFTFDAPRARTAVEHLLSDHRDGPAASRAAHYEEWARFNEGLPDEHVPGRAAEFAADDARHHFHVWELPGFLALLIALTLPCELLAAQAIEPEFSVILRRT